MVGYSVSPLHCRVPPTVIDVKSISRLSPQQERILDLLHHGLTYKEVAAALQRSISTIKTHVGIIFHKTGSRSRAEAAFNLFGRQHCAFDVPITHLPVKCRRAKAA
jgi:DNA-binding NarL/FixJ family response regulator